MIFDKLAVAVALAPLVVIRAGSSTGSCSDTHTTIDSSTQSSSSSNDYGFLCRLHPAWCYSNTWGKVSAKTCFPTASIAIVVISYSIS
jgi:hypothetical protein